MRPPLHDSLPSFWEQSISCCSDSEVSVPADGDGGGQRRLTCDANVESGWGARLNTHSAGKWASTAAYASPRPVVPGSAGHAPVLMKSAPSVEPVVEKAQHEPHWPWSLMGVTAPFVVLRR